MGRGFDYQSAMNDISKDVNDLVTRADIAIKPALDEIGSVVAINVSRSAPLSDNEFYYYKGQKVSNTHIKDDVEYRIKKSRKMGCKYVSVSGGRKTWAKWHIVNDGHVAPNGRFIRGSHFIEKAIVNSESLINSVVDKFIGDVIR